MRDLEVLIGLILAATLLAAAARRVGAPYPVFLALGGALLAFVPGAPSFTVPPELALALFVAPILLDAAYDASPRDLRDNWAPVTGLVVVAVGLTTIAVAVVARMLMPTMAWAPAIALGAVVAPPDAAAATALPAAFPFRDVIVLTAYSVVLGTLALQGLTLGPLLRALDLRDDDPVGHELTAARERAVRAMRASEEIGDDAFHRMEEELDGIEMSGGGKENGES